MSGKTSRSSRPVAADPFEPLDERTALLAHAASATRGPSPRVKAALLARVRAAKSSAGLRPAGASQRLALPRAASPTVAWRFASVAADEGWVRLPFPGVKMREVTVDATRDTALLYVEMMPGAIFPDHEHAADERGLVLTGDLVMAGRRLVAGDFYEAAAGTRHERISSPSGCAGLLWVGARAWQQWREKLAAV